MSRIHATATRSRFFAGSRSAASAATGPANCSALGCISCHDPHVLPAENKKVEYYRDRCLKCHQDKGCSLPLAERKERNAQDSCIACHMPRFQSEDIAHTAVTDHRILRQPDKPEPRKDPRRLQAGDIPLVNFFQKEVDPHGAAAERDLGLALLYLAKDPGPLRAQLTPLALPLLERAVQAAPKDVPVGEAYAFALALSGRSRDALAAFETTLAQAPDRELSLNLAAQVAERQGHGDEAVGYLRRLVVVNPWVWDYRFALAKLLAQRGEWQGVLSESEAALRLNPSHKETRMFLTAACLHTGQKERAEKELETLVALNPGEASTLRTWFREQLP
jgi:cytochrome c-type biogenesis protein CcmH/NrfG